MIRLSSIVQYPETKRLSEQPGGIRAAKALAQKTAFLSHSHLDRRYALSMQSFLRSKGWIIYIDWQDEAMPDVPSRATAENIQGRIRELDWFLFLATANSANSKWCPWEIGYADGVKGKDPIVIIPTRDDWGKNYGNKYLQLYRRIEDVGTGWEMLEPGRYSGTSLKRV